MNLYKKPNSSFWWYDFMVDGKRFRGSTKRTSKAEANRVLADLYATEMNRKQFGTKPEISLSDAFDRIINSVEGSTRISYDLCKRKFLGGTMGSEGRLKARGERYHWPKGIMLHEVDDGLVEDLIEARKAEGLRANSINVELRVLKRVVNAHEKRFQVNPGLEIKLIEGFTKTRFLTEFEEARIERMLTDRAGDGEGHAKALDLFIFLRDTGVRISEALNARWREIDLARGLYNVFRIKTKSSNVIPLSGRVVAMLAEKQRALQKAPFENMDRAIKHLRRAIDEVANDDPLLCAQRGKATIHTLRDTYGARMVAAGMSLHELAKLLGHTTAAMSAKYAQLEARDVAEKARAIIAMANNPTVESQITTASNLRIVK